MRNHAFLGVLLLLSACSHTQYPARLIDAHAHFEEEDNDKKMSAEFKASGVVGAVIHLKGDEAYKPVKDITLRVCAGIRPGITLHSVETGIKAGRFHCMKIYLGYVPKWASDPFYTPFYKLAEKHGVPVVFHTGDTYDKMAKVKYADPLTVDEIAVTYPKVKFVLAHMGNPWFQSAAEVVYKNDNVYVDLSALMLGDVSQQSEETTDELVVKPLRWFYYFVENPKKFLFGTDWSLLKIKPYAQLIQKAIPKEQWEAVFYSNAAEVFKFPKTR